MLDLLTYLAIVAAHYGLEFYRRHWQGELRAPRWRQVCIARPAALRMELNPHVLSNTLTAVGRLVRRKRDTAPIDTLGAAPCSGDRHTLAAVHFRDDAIPESDSLCVSAQGRVAASLVMTVTCKNRGVLAHTSPRQA